MALGGEFSFWEIVRQYSLWRNDFADYFPKKITTKKRKFFLTGSDSLAAILSEVELTTNISELYVPEHYCFSSLERSFLKGAVTRPKIIVYKQCAEVPNHQVAVLVSHFLMSQLELEQSIQNLVAQGHIVINDYVMRAFELQKYQGQYAFNSLRKFGFQDVSVCYGLSFRVPTTLNFRRLFSKFYAGVLKDLYKAFRLNLLDRMYLAQIKKAELCLAVREINRPILIAPYYIKQVLDIREKNQRLLVHRMAAKFDVISCQDDIGFFVLLLSARDQIRDQLRKHKMYAPVHWPDSKNENLRDHSLSIPIDQRASAKDYENLFALLSDF
jgi:hypothetical protein